MNKLILTLCLTIVLSVGVFAQNNDEYKKNEFYAGFSHQQVGSSDREPYNGFEVSVVRNVHRYVGIKGDFSASFRNLTFTSPTFSPAGGAAPVIRLENRNSLYNFLGGVQIKDNVSTARIKPFAHALVGVAHSRFRTTNISCISNCSSAAVNTADFSFSDTGFGGAFGGGLDIKLSDKVDFRAIQIDYNPTRLNNRWDNNIRFGIGFVIK